MRIKHGHEVSELLNADGKTFLFQGEKVSKITDKIENNYIMYMDANNLYGWAMS